MGLYSGGLIIGGTFASEIWRPFLREGLFLEVLIIGILRYYLKKEQNVSAHFPGVSGVEI